MERWTCCSYIRGDPGSHGHVQGSEGRGEICSRPREVREQRPDNSTIEDEIRTDEMESFNTAEERRVYERKERVLVVLSPASFIEEVSG